MLEQPAIPQQSIIDCLRAAYGLTVTNLDFLPLGADINTAVYRVAAADGQVYFLKVRSGEFHTASVAVPYGLHRLGVRSIIPVVPTLTGQLWTLMGVYTLILYPFIHGQHGFSRRLTDRQWKEFGAAIKQFHSARFPADITRGVPGETFSPRWRDSVKRYCSQVSQLNYADVIAQETADFLKSKTAETLDLVERTAQYAALLQAHPLEFILCHGDMHAWNLLVVDDHTFYIVDWDTLIFAPKERDLMFIGSGLGGGGHSPTQETALFYHGYGPTTLNPVALAYYRYERIVEDIAVFCDQIFLSTEKSEDRQQALTYLKSNYAPGQTIDLARQAEGRIPA